MCFAEQFGCISTLQSPGCTRTSLVQASHSDAGLVALCLAAQTTVFLYLTTGPRHILAQQSRGPTSTEGCSSCSCNMSRLLDVRPWHPFQNSSSVNLLFCTRFEFWQAAVSSLQIQNLVQIKGFTGPLFFRACQGLTLVGAGVTSTSQRQAFR